VGLGQALGREVALVLDGPVDVVEEGTAVGGAVDVAGQKLRAALADERRERRVARLEQVVRQQEFVDETRHLAHRLRAGHVP
jgi:hypothetical protein